MIVRLPAAGDATSLELAGEVVVRDVDGAALERVRVPPRVEIRGPT